MIVPWYEVRNYMHVDSGWREGTPFAAQTGQSGASRAGAAFVEADYAAAVEKPGNTSGGAKSGLASGGDRPGYILDGDTQGLEAHGSGAETGSTHRGDKSGKTLAGSNQTGGAHRPGSGTSNRGAETDSTRWDGTFKGAGTPSAAENNTSAGGNSWAAGKNVLVGGSSQAAGEFLASDEYVSSPDGYTDYGPAGYAGAESRRAAFKVAEGRTDTRSFKQQEKDILAAEDELKAIFERTYGPVKSRVGQSESYKPSRTVTAEIPERYRKPKPKPQKEYLLVDGYNIIFAWENLRALAQRDIKAARDTLLDDLSNYAGYTKANVICVFDAYKVAGGTEQVYRYHNIDVIFTKEAETADLYIEKAAHELTKQYAVKVATSDAVEQVIIYGAGAIRLSAMNFYEEVRSAEREMKATYVADDTDVCQRVGSPLKDELEKALAGTELPEETN
ncbi:MAG: NYN domain-containing protein [Lachnospiraceae bacterium]|nr:NYN domain-containing protein [Lachnospiraceae bacterium]